MTDKQPEALKWADAVQGIPQLAEFLRTQHSAIERKDALLRQALEALNLYKAYGWPDRSGVIPAITKELSQ